MIAGVAGRVAHEQQQASAGSLWSTVVQGSAVVGAAMQVPPHPPFLSAMPVSAAVALADELADEGWDIDGVSGDAAATSAFAERWAARRGRQVVVRMAMRMHRLARLAAPAGVPGAAAVASEDDVPLVTRWLGAFFDEASRGAVTDDAAEVAVRRVAAGEVHLWRRADEVVSLAAVSVPSTVARVGPVYTPLEHRRCGYGAAVTAAASAAALAAGARDVALYTDLANPTSNAVYRSIGYVPHSDAQELAFLPPAG